MFDRRQTPAQQRVYNERKRKENNTELVSCLECGLEFVRIGSHVVQVHGYSTAQEYRREHGLMARETTTEEYKEKMRDMARNADNLAAGADTRFVAGGDSGEKLKEFWRMRMKVRGKR